MIKPHKIAKPSSAVTCFTPPRRTMSGMEHSWTRQFLIAACLTAGLGYAPTSRTQPSSYVPVKWEHFIKVEGQPLPIPQQWLDTDEARATHNLTLPESVPKPKLFDFKAAGDESWFVRHREVAGKYFDHLCASESGQWIFKTVKNVEGLYLARPQAPPTTDVLADPYGPEMPWIQRWFFQNKDSLGRDSRWLISPPEYNYQMVEQPRRSVDWQMGISERYIRLSGLTREFFIESGNVVPSLNVRSPMKVVGIALPTTQYGYTWRGLRRGRDREFNIAGGEVLIYDRHTSEVLAVRRQFLLASPNARGKELTLWEIAASCPQLRARPGHAEFSQLAFDVLQTIQPSTTGRN